MRQPTAARLPHSADALRVYDGPSAGRPPGVV